ncbi:MAG: polysaccharide deacetylase family protein [Acidobacteriia bacterium]|nr:polysaccharide deacetylase family protein [Terriglobia bacterium]
MTPVLRIATYHYVRDVAGTEWENLKVLSTAEFARQIDYCAETFEVVSLDRALDFLQGRYAASRDLCLLAFDDGLREHFAIAAMLRDRNLSAAFFPITSCLDQETVAAVHQNHLLMARLGVRVYRRKFMDRLNDIFPDFPAELPDPEIAARTYRWDDRETAEFKYLFNFALPAAVQERVVAAVFRESIGAQAEAARELYLSWSDLKEMRSWGMTIGGHTHTHRALSRLSPAEMKRELATCRRLLDQNLLEKDMEPQRNWPFSFPFGKRDSYTRETIEELRRLNFHCALTTQDGGNAPGADLFQLRRTDCRDIPSCAPLSASRA